MRGFWVDARRIHAVTVTLCIALVACAERDPPGEAAPATSVATEALVLDATPVDAAPVDAAPADAAAPDAAASDAGDAAPTSDAGTDGGGSGIKIVAGAPVFEAAPETKAPRKRKPRARKPRKKPARKAIPPSVARPARRISPMQTIRSHYGDVHACYSRVALKDPTIAGRITLQWTIGKTGMPQAVAIKKDTLKDKSVGKCLKARAKRWKFPAPGGGVQVISYPFDLRVQ